MDWQQGDVDSALQHFLPFVTISKRLIAHYPDSLGYREELAYALNNIGFAKQAKGDLAGAVEWFGASRANQSAARRPATRQRSLAGSALGEFNAEAVARRKLGDLAGALATHDKELTIKEAVLAHDTTNSEHQRDVAVAHAYRGELRVLMGDIAGAVLDARAAHGIFSTVAAHDTSDAIAKWQLAKSDRQIAQALLERGDAAAALAELHAGDAVITRSLAANPNDPYMVGERMLTSITLSRALLALGHVQEALAAAHAASEATEARLKAKPGDIESHRAAADASLAVGTALLQSGDARGAHDSWVHAVALEDSITRTDPETELLAVQAAALLHLGERDEAKPIVEELVHRGYRRPTFMRIVREAANKE